METNVIRRIHELRQMTVGELRLEWERLHGEPARSTNRDFLWRRLAWRVQELTHGGLSQRAQSKLKQLFQEAPIRATTPKQSRLEADLGTTSKPPTRGRDARLPTPGTVLTRQYHGREIRVLTLDKGFEWEGCQYRSLSAVAKAITGQKWNGWLFFGLTKRKR